MNYRAKCLGIMTLKVLPTSCFRYNSEKKKYKILDFKIVTDSPTLVLMMIMMMMLMMMTNCFCCMVKRQRRLALFPGGAIVRDPHHRESPIRRKHSGFDE